ncbi:hypothetical protein AVEN_61554-1 [Araneus ventricosus]|uniref:Uncharacterized protein n=1 Tax=Araneus ventricosus TaxID=182803 RepID=A0A4Y2TWK1_ARAVE|nr:hypothetical protein AVEN_49519-1 [Araneus ventricosus]GBO03646.1 hypothetical protein AVEN_221443-1 [Araneus ventricosus]GBO04225.1 hypothetical protein AVEN_41197-1 [Araneus ventricosus]GBO04228.1 hypothetical protein AVEN_61554-1 [Araneus ventricosus]
MIPRGLFWYPRFGWELDWVPFVKCGTQPNSQPNRGYQNRRPNQNHRFGSIILEEDLFRSGMNDMSFGVMDADKFLRVEQEMLRFG